MTYAQSCASLADVCKETGVSASQDMQTRPIALWRQATRECHAGRCVVKLIIYFIIVLFLLVPHRCAMAATGETLEVQVDDVVVRTSPALGAAVVMTLERGRKLKELRRQGNWIKVITYGTTGLDGWVRAADVRPLVSDGLETRPDTKQEGNQPPSSTVSTEPEFILVIGGEAQAFRAICVVIDGRGTKKRINIYGHGPKSYGLDGEVADCRVDRIEQRAGTLIAELYARNSSLPLGTNSTNEAFGCVHVRSDGPWGRAGGRRCSRVIHRF